MDLSDYTGGEIFQMWAERMRMDWQHTSFLAAYLIEVNRGKKGKKTSPNELNPMEKGRKTSSSNGISLNSPDGFAQLAKVAHWPGNS